MDEKELQEIESNLPELRKAANQMADRQGIDYVRLHRYCDDMQRLIAEVRRLRQALHPFAYFAHQYNQKPIGRMDDQLYGIHAGTEWEAELRRSDCQTALDLIGGLGSSPEKATVK